ncbi:dephospho-CoA kinase [Methylovulum miyakonense]|uniref:dephospho-CoA kinase n=1 Tax=Methylovulum miyakonense TaxID=645578 RepID=UPI00037D04EC|nr:dephospho-CoA kinase [Methylovulum miyakonense]
MLRIGLTGGIGCGKSTVANLFSQLDVPIIDADIISRNLVQPGQPALAAIRQVFGGKILNVDGSLDRSHLRDIIFADAEAKQKLESILHPLVYQAILAAVGQTISPYCVICIPLLFETKMTRLADRILVIDCPTEIQVMRVRQRDHLSDGQIQAIIGSQVPRDFRIANANDLIENTGTNDKLAEQVKKLHNLYLSISNCQD